MLLLLVLALVAGVATAISPCVLPVLPILLAGGATDRKPLRIIAGLVASFSLFTLFATWALDRVGLPGDLLRNLAIAFLFVLAAVLLVPRVGVTVERGLAVFSRFRPARAGGGFGLGVALGLVFVPCAGPVLGALTTAAANENFGGTTIATTLVYAVGASVPMLAIAYGGREAAGRLRRLAPQVRAASGVVVAAVALALVFHVEDHLTTVHTPGLTGLENRLAGTAEGRKQLARLRGERAQLAVVHPAKKGLPDYGLAPPIHADGAWINSKPLTIEGLRGKVVLIDFWTYSCINCLRTLPHLNAWYAEYRSKGFVIVGVHTPEFAFEHVTSNVRAAVRRLGVTWPVVQDNRYKTWDSYANEYWPAEYLIDRSGHVRHTKFGEGDYGGTERAIRELLGDTGTHAAAVADRTPTGVLTAESYLGYSRLQNYVGRTPVPDKPATYAFPSSLPLNTLSYAGGWTVGSESIRAGRNARLRLHFEARNVYVVLGGRGTVKALIDGKPAGTLHVDAQRLYTVRESARFEQAVLELRFSPGIEAYSFTFG